MDRENYVGNRIRQYRKARGWSQETLALQAEINPAFLGHLERGLKVPTITTLRKITDALGITLSEFFRDDPSGLSVSGPEKQEIINDIAITVKDLSVPELEHLAEAVREIAKMCNEK